MELTTRRKGAMLAGPGGAERGDSLNRASAIVENSALGLGAA
jgi:hypothetical protein